MGELLSVKVSIANRSYPLRVSKEEEEKVRVAAQSINQRMKEFEENFAVKDKQDLLAMCALQFASETMGPPKSNEPSKNSQAREKVKQLNLILDEYLSMQE
jgi:cell division protein ZapA (FtsZ GTPase activity inhibitor)